MFRVATHSHRKGTISNATTRASGEAHKLHRFRKKISRVSEWLSEYHVPDDTRKEVQVRREDGGCNQKGI